MAFNTSESLDHVTVKSNSFSQLSHWLLDDTVQYGSSLGFFEDLDSDNVESLANTYFDIPKSLESFLLNEFNLYSHNSRNLLIRCKKKNLIFPHHNFW